MLWLHLNWALGLRELGFDVIWLEAASPKWTSAEIRQRANALRRQLAPYQFDTRLVICDRAGAKRDDLPNGGMTLDDAAAQSALLLNLRYDLGGDVVRRFRRSAVIDMDPGIVQHYIARGDFDLAPHDVYFSISSTVGTPQAKFPDAGIEWKRARPAVSLSAWPVVDPKLAGGVDPGPRFTTISQWYMETEWIVESDDSCYANDKRSGFEPYLGLPACLPSGVKMELAINLDGYDEERRRLENLGWRVRESREISSSLDAYQRYIRGSRGEFSCAKPSYVRMQTGWVSDRTLCYLASGRPAVVQHTGPNPILPDARGLFRFCDIEQAAKHLRTASEDYEQHCREARALAEEYFDAPKVVGDVVSAAMA